MLVEHALIKIRVVQIPECALPVEHTCAGEWPRLVSKIVRIRKGIAVEEDDGFVLAVFRDRPEFRALLSVRPSEDRPWAYLQLDESGKGKLIVSHSSLLYAYFHLLVEDWRQRPVSEFVRGRYISSAFRWHRPLFDYLLTQMWRTARHFDPEEHIRELALNGYTHVEVNGLASPVPLHEAVPGEFYSQFYSYCPALDQYVWSEINKGVYPRDYLNANLSLLKKYAEIGRKYGMVPGILCFEPRSVPETFFHKYPTLRGPRVDHPYRSRKPRYALTLAHPLAQQHYREMIQRLLQEVPDLAYMSIWSNDSGAGFEYTGSLYVGRNGGPFLIREWRTHEHVAEAAGKNIVHFMKLLRDAAQEINPEFRVSLRLEPFKDEHDVIVENLEPYLDIEVPSLLVRGYDLPYQHPRYEDITGIAGSIHHIELVQEEEKWLHHHLKKGIETHLMYSQGTGFNLEPLVGIPFPHLLHTKLQSMHLRGIRFAANLGGFTPRSLAPYHINREVFRAFMLEPKRPLDDVLRSCAEKWSGKEAPALLAVWEKADEVIQWLPPVPLYSNFGFVWLRLWVRPIVPDLLAIPEQERRYYEDYMVGSSNNTNLVDLGKDVLFQLITDDFGEKYVQRVDANVLPRLDEAIQLCENRESEIFSDQKDRLRALRCWIGVQRSVCAWVVAVYRYLKSENDYERMQWYEYLQQMIDWEIANTKELLNLWQTSEVDFMVVSGTGETCFMYGENFGALLEKKLELMSEYRNVEPRIDLDIMWKV